MFRGRGGSGLNLLSSFTGPPPSDLRVYPTTANPTTKGGRQSVVVQAIYSDGLTRVVTDDAGFTLSHTAPAHNDK